MSAQPGLRLDCTTRFLIQGQFICLQWVSPHYEAGDYKPRRNWENFPNQCICSLTMKFPNGKDNWLLRMVRGLGFECKSGNMPFLIGSKTNISFRPPELVLTYDMWASLGFLVALLLPKPMTLPLEVMDLTSSPKSSLGASLRLVEEDWRQLLGPPFNTHQLIKRGQLAAADSHGYQTLLLSKYLVEVYPQVIHMLKSNFCIGILWSPDSCNFRIYPIRKGSFGLIILGFVLGFFCRGVFETGFFYVTLAGLEFSM